LTDPDPNVRRAALSAVGFHPEIVGPEAEQIALRARADSDPAVHSAAMELLSHLEATRASNAGDVGSAIDALESSIDPDQAAVPGDPQ
jgi:hypothetical protein